MSITFSKDLLEKHYTKKLLRNKLKPVMSTREKYEIFKQHVCWDILFKDEHAAWLCYEYSRDVLKKPFPEGKPYIAKDPEFSYCYAKMIIKGRFPACEDYIHKNPQYAEGYIYFLEGLLHIPMPNRLEIISKIRNNIQYSKK